ncbi:hypothetical protein BASA81_008429 [Batrachochytrium salamandrivorans]|nr:hypothetical protein BASA81_008429 [Batrachochytrium salamandrivorans]
MKLFLFKDSAGEVIKQQGFADCGEIFNEFLGCTLVFRGRVLSKGEEDFAAYEAPVVYVVRGHASFPATITTTDAEEEELRCRICYSEENLPGDELFRPCKCRGSVGLVHRACLNAWREHPDNPAALSHCVNCNYRYQIRHSWFHVLFADADQFAIVFTVVFLSLIVCLVSLGSFLLVPNHLTNRMFRLVEWEPANAWERHLAVGFGCVGLVGFAVHLNDVVQMVRHREHLLGMGLMVLTNGGKVVGVFCLSGLLVAFHLLFRRCQQWSRRMFARLGEHILPVVAEEGGGCLY